MNTRRRIIATGLATGLLSIVAWTLFLANRIIWLVGISTMLDDVESLPDNLAALILLFAHLPGWLLAAIAALITGVWVWQTYHLYSSIGLSRDEITAARSAEAQSADHIEKMSHKLIVMQRELASITADQRKDREDNAKYAAYVKLLHQLWPKALSNRETIEIVRKKIDQFPLPEGPLSVVNLVGLRDACFLVGIKPHPHEYEMVSFGPEPTLNSWTERPPAIPTGSAAEEARGIIQAWLAEIDRLNTENLDIMKRFGENIIKETRLGYVLPPPPNTGP